MWRDSGLVGSLASAIALGPSIASTGGIPSKESRSHTFRSRTPAPRRISAMRKPVPPRHTPHSTKSPGMSHASTMSATLARSTRASTETGGMTNGRTLSSVASRWRASIQLSNSRWAACWSWGNGRGVSRVTFVSSLGLRESGSPAIWASGGHTWGRLTTGRNLTFRMRAFERPFKRAGISDQVGAPRHALVRTEVERDRGVDATGSPGSRPRSRGAPCFSGRWA